jgi:formate-dependent nitrite reductase membrane component NrfD
LLAATAVPLWAKNALLMGPLFLASALSTAASAISLVLLRNKQTRPDTLRRLESVERVALAAELAALAASRAHLGETAKPMATGRTGAVVRYGVAGAGIAAPLAIQALNRRHARAWLTAGSVLTLAGGFCLRYAVVAAGRASADDPRATFDFTRTTDQNTAALNRG